MADGIRIEGLPPLQKIIKKVGSLKPVKVGLGKSIVHLRSELRDIPRVSRRPVAQYWTDKQRRGFFYHLKAGNIEVPYYRRISKKSEDLSHSWGTKSRKGGLEWTLGNDTSYGQLVQDKDKQSRYHKETGWPTVQKVLKDETGKVNRIIKLQIDLALEGRR